MRCFICRATIPRRTRLLAQEVHRLASLQRSQGNLLGLCLGRHILDAVVEALDMRLHQPSGAKNNGKKKLRPHVAKYTCTGILYVQQYRTPAKQVTFKTCSLF